MIVLDCPWCGPRNVSEFHSLGEVVKRPDPRAASRAEWRSYLYLRSNPAGPVHERWLHRAGCRRFFDAERDTTDNTVHATWGLGPWASGADS
jgi:heterotetrameric sarcosine oxidase delta subunit